MSVDYNDAATKISIHLGDVYDQALSMRDDLDAIDTAWEQTMWAWNQLKLSWVGKTQQAVDDFQKAIDKVQNEIFGTSKKDPNDPNKQVLDQPGLYQQVRELASNAVQNYDWTDFGVTNMFTQVTADITGTTYAMGNGPDGTFVTIGPQPKPTGLAPDKTDPYISETFH